MVDDAVRAARKALRGEWGRLGIGERATRLQKVADAIEARFDCFVAAEVADTGKPVALASRLDVPRAAANFRMFADMIKTAGQESFQTETSDGKSASELRCSQVPRRRGDHHSMELAFAPADVEGCASLGVR